MNYRTLIVAVALIAVPFVVPCASAAPKAYNTVFDKGKAAGLKILFEFDHRYVEASKIKIIESASEKTTKFSLSGREGQTGTGLKKGHVIKVHRDLQPVKDVKGGGGATGKFKPITDSTGTTHSH